MAARPDGRSRLIAPDAKGGRVRVFFALWPDDDARDALAPLASDAQAECGGRAIAREKIHLTLFFVGDIERARLGALEALAACVRAPEFCLRVDTLGYWRHNRIVWAGAGVCPSGLSSLAAGLHAALAREGVRGEDRPYVPHVTLVRDARRAPVSTPAATFEWHVRDFVLVESAPVGGGVRYELRGRWPLRTL